MTYIFDSPTRIGDNFSIEFHMKVISWILELGENSFHEFLHLLCKEYFLPVISSSYHLITIQSETLAPESKKIYTKAPVRFTYGKSEASPAASSFRLDIYLEKAQKVIRFNLRGVTDTYRIFDADIKSAAYKQICRLEEFFTTQHPFYRDVSVGTGEKVERIVICMQWVKLPTVVPKKIEKLKQLSTKKPKKAKPRKASFKKPVVKTATLAIARGFNR